MSIREELDPEIVRQLEQVAANNGAGDDESPQFSVRRLDPGDMRNPTWAYGGRLLVGALNSLVGAGGAGKGTFASWMLARATRGELPGSFEGTPVNVLIVGDEDDSDEVWTPRLAVARADFDHIFSLDYTAGVPLDLVRDIGVLEDFVSEHDVGIVYLDQVLDHLGAEVNANLPKDVRMGLALVRGMAGRRRCSILYSAHPNKMRGDASLRDRTGGSGQFTDLPRVGLFLGYHPDKEGYRALVRGKGNVGRIPPALVFKIEGSFIQNPRTGEAIEVGEIQDLQEEENLPAEVVSVNPPRERKPSRFELAEDFLVAFASDGKWHSRKETKQACRDAGLSEDTFKEAFSSLPKETRQDEHDKREVHWRLTNDDIDD